MRTTDRRVELYLRGDTYGTYDRQQAILERVRGLEAAGTVEAASVEADWQRVRTPEQDPRDGALATYEEFREWADENGFTLEPAFERRDRAYLGTDVVREVVTFPVVSLALYDADQLRAVFPCSGEEQPVHYTVQDCLGALESGQGDRWLRRFSPVRVDREAPRLAVAPQ